MTDRQKQRLNEIRKHSPLISGIFERAFAGKSKATALKAKCLDCCCFQRVEVTKCTAEGCPLWLYRPYIQRPKARSLKNAATPEATKSTN